MAHGILFSGFRSKRSALQVPHSIALDQLLQDSLKWSFIDTPDANFCEQIKKELADANYSPFSKDGKAQAAAKGTRVAIVGGGASGLLCAWQLLKFGMGEVRVFEAYEDPATTPDRVRAGRLFEARLDPADKSTAVQLGAMRFPDLAQTFWHYYKLFVHPTDNPSLSPFPNPAKVPTLLFAKNATIVREAAYYLPIDSDDTPFPLPADVQVVADKHVAAFRDYVPPGQLDSVAVMSGLLKAQVLAPADHTRAINFMSALRNDLRTKSYRDFLVDRKLTASDLQIISDLGFGTGGFGPLFGVSAIDIMRLVLWDFVNEIEVPDQASLPLQMAKAVRARNGAMEYNTAVDSVYWDLAQEEYVLCAADKRWRADYVVFAMTHNAALELLDWSEALRGTSGRKEEWIAPFTDGRAKNLVASDLLADMRNQMDIVSSKVFHLVRGPQNAAAAASFPVLKSPGSANVTHPVGCVFGDTMEIGNRYILPLQGKDVPTSEKCIGLHYGWGQAAGYTALTLTDYFANGRISLPSGHASIPAFNQILNADLSYTYAAYNWNRDPAIAGDDAKYFREFAVNDPGYGAVQGIFWNDVPFVKCGFKLDRPGVGTAMVWNAIDRMKLKVDPNGFTGQIFVWERNTYQCQHIAVSRMFFCGDSFSHYGGWVEGAFHSALMTCAGLVGRWSRDKNQPGAINSAFIERLAAWRPA